MRLDLSGENAIMNRALRRALADADLTEVDVAASLAVDPKTVRAWLAGRLPYPANRRKVARLVGREEADLWPDADAVQASGDVRVIYRHRWAVPREAWLRLFASAEREIGILVYSGLFLADDAGLRAVLAGKADAGVRIRILLGDPDSDLVAQRGADEGIDQALAAKIRNALALYRPLAERENVEIRLHATALYASIYRADDDLLVNLHAYGLHAAHAPVFRMHATSADDVAALYLASFEKVWDSASPAIAAPGSPLQARRTGQPA